MKPAIYIKTKSTSSNMPLRKMADEIVKELNVKGFIIQRYDAYSTYSVYLKLDYGVCNTIRISDHEGKERLKYRYNLLFDGENNIVEDTYTRYYFDQHHIGDLINQILFDKMVKIQKYGEDKYWGFMLKNKAEHMNDKGFWRDAKLVTADMPSTALNVTVPKSRPSINGGTMKLQQMPDGTYACGPDVALNVFSGVITNQIQLDANAKFHPGEKVRVTASYDELVNYYATSNETINQAKTHALQILGKTNSNTEELDVGVIIGATECSEGMFYTLELPLIPMEFLPEEFLSSYRRY